MLDPGQASLKLLQTGALGPLCGWKSEPRLPVSVSSLSGLLPPDPLPGAWVSLASLGADSQS